ncbi:MAG: S41 family peptidase, partial [Acidobacteriota bacterium]
RFKGLIVGLLVGFLGIFLIGMMVTRNIALEGTYTYLKLFNEVLSLIRNAYVDEVDTSSLMSGAYHGMLLQLDPFSEYFTPDEYKRYQEFQSSRRGKDELAGVGLRIALTSGVLVVVSVQSGSEAASLGITPGNRVQRIADQSTRTLNLFEAESLLAGKPGTKVSVTILRREEPRKLEVTLTRRRLLLPDPSLEMIPHKKGLAILRIPHFRDGVVSEVAALLRDAGKAGINRLLIDLRGNAWGDMPEAVEAAGLFVGNSVVASLQNRNGRVRDLRPGRSQGVAYSGIIEVLIDRSTAEASELFAAALRDHGATIVGETSFGVGAEQDLLPLKNGGYLKLSVRKYVSASGLSWHGTGLKPAEKIVVSQDNMTWSERMNKQLEEAVEHLEELDRPSRASRPEAAVSSSGVPVEGTVAG